MSVPFDILKDICKSNPNNAKSRDVLVNVLCILQWICKVIMKIAIKRLAEESKSLGHVE